MIRKNHIKWKQTIKTIIDLNKYKILMECGNSEAGELSALPPLTTDGGPQWFQTKISFSTNLNRGAVTKAQLVTVQGLQHRRMGFKQWKT